MNYNRSSYPELNNGRISNMRENMVEFNPELRKVLKAEGLMNYCKIPIGFNGISYKNK